MKPILLVWLLAISHYANAQASGHLETVTFDAPAPSFFKGFSFDNTHHTNTWQIGKPQKTLFDTAYYSNKAIITDTVNNCVANDTSVFTVSFVTGAPGIFLAGLSFYYKLDIDTSCHAMVEALGPANTWINLTDTPYLYKQLDTFIQIAPLYGTLDTPNLHASTNQWKLVKLNTSLSASYNGTFRFTFTTGSNTQNKEGWMIDDITGIYYAGLSAPLNYTSNYTCYPNPSTGSFVINGQSYENVTMEITDVLGRRMLHKELIQENGSINDRINIPGAPDGVYYIRLQTKESIETIRLSLQH